MGKKITSIILTIILCLYGLGVLTYCGLIISGTLTKTGGVDKLMNYGNEMAKWGTEMSDVGKQLLDVAKESNKIDVKKQLDLVYKQRDLNLEMLEVMKYQIVQGGVGVRTMEETIALTREAVSVQAQITSRQKDLYNLQLEALDLSRSGYASAVESYNKGVQAAKLGDYGVSIMDKSDYYMNH